MPYRYPSAVWGCSQVHSQVVPPSSEKIMPKLVARTICSGRSAGSRIPNDAGSAPLPRAGPAQASSATRSDPGGPDADACNRLHPGPAHFRAKMPPPSFRRC